MTCLPTVVERSLAYYRLHFIVSGTPSLVSDTITELVSILKVLNTSRVVCINWYMCGVQKCSSDTADHGEKEILLPVLQLLRQFIMEVMIVYNV